MRPQRPGINACVLPSWLFSCGSLLKLKKLDVYFIGSLHSTPVLVVWFCKVQSKYIVWFCKVQYKRFGVCSFGLSVNLALHICLLHYSTTSRLLPRKLSGGDDRRWAGLTMVTAVLVLAQGSREKTVGFFFSRTCSAHVSLRRNYKDSWKLEWLVVKADLFRLDFPVSLPTILGKVLPFRFSW